MKTSMVMKTLLFVCVSATIIKGTTRFLGQSYEKTIIFKNVFGFGIFPRNEIGSSKLRGQKWLNSKKSRLVRHRLSAEASYDYTDGGIFPMDGVDHSEFDRDNFIVFKRDYYEKHLNGEIGDIGKDESLNMMNPEDKKYLTENEFNLRAWDATFDTCDPFPTGE